MQALIKILITAGIVAAASEAARRSTLLGAIIVSLPLTSILALAWLYRDTRDVAKVSAMATDILWLVGPSLLFFVALPLLLNHGVKFWPALVASCGIMIVGYQLVVWAKT